MNVHYEEMNNNIKLIHDVNNLTELKKYNESMQDLFCSTIIEYTKKPIFECCIEFLDYLMLLNNVIDIQITNTLNDMEYSQPADED